MTEERSDYEVVALPPEVEAEQLLLVRKGSHLPRSPKVRTPKFAPVHRLANFSIEVASGPAAPSSEMSWYGRKLLAILRALWVCLILPWMRIPMFFFSAFMCLCDQVYKLFFRDNIPFILIYIAGIYYGGFVSWSACGLDWPCLVDTTKRLHIYFFFAKTFVRISNILTACSSFLGIRSVSSKLDSVPKMNPYSFNWRRVHADLALQSYFFAAGHVIAHAFRYLDAEQGRRTEDYEMYFLVTGTLLSLLFILQLLTLISRWIFRRFHWLLAIIIPIVYYIHSHSYVMLIFLLLYCLDYALHKEEVRDLHVYGNEKNIILKVNCGRNIPNTPGYYYQIAVNNFMASYTFMPYQEGDRDYALFFVQKNSVVANELWKIIQTGNFSRDKHQNIMLNQPSKVVGLWGPFDSNDYVSRKELSKCYITSGTGRSIQYDSYAHRKNMLHTNTKIVYYHLKGRGQVKVEEVKGSEEVKDMETGHEREQVERSEKESTQATGMEVKLKHRNTQTRMSVSIEIDNKKAQFRQYDELSELIEQNDTISVLHKGVFTVDHLEKLFQKLQPKGFHFIFCGGGVLSVLKEYQKNRTKFQVGNDRIHIESFSADFTFFGSTAQDWSQVSLLDPFSDLG
eukprot:TRINITY_DN14369_c0_g1_i2.p1 TRINITY_DN14369_c0_g1~~TRINITY_DN14369_c0_g1_i2.p1  ORF type:complete len:623 (-),score=77.51 TRINITY_DN14369_c0_g1_i2:46-1914(-)